MAKLVEKRKSHLSQTRSQYTPSQEHHTLLRFEIYQGAYTKDTKFLVSPFIGPPRLIKDVPYKADQTLEPPGGQS